MQRDSKQARRYDLGKMLDWWTVQCRNVTWGHGVTTEHAKYLQTWSDNPCNKMNHIGVMVPPSFSKWLGDQLPKGKFIDLFCGHGGFSKGFIDAGHEHLLGIDNDLNILKCYNREIGECICADLTKFQDLPKMEVDYIIGSPPCNNFTNANPKRDGYAGIKTLKMFFYWVSYYQPKIWIMENVPGVKRHYPGRVYDMHDYGVPQHRKRFIGSNFDFKNSILQKTLEGFL